MEEKLKKNESEKLICEASEKPKWEKSETIICDESEKTKCEASEKPKCEKNETLKCEESEKPISEASEKNETLKCEESEKTISEASEKNETLKCEESEKPISEASEKPKCEKSETIKSEKSEKPISEKNEKPKDEETLNNTPSKEEEDIIIKLKANLLKEGFFELPKVKELNDEVRQKLLWILSSHIRNSENWDTTIPFKLALFDYLGFIVHLNQQYNSKVMKMYHKMKEILDYKDDSTIRKEWPTKRKNKYQEENPYKNKANEFFLT